MNIQLKNLSGLFKNTRTRTIIIFTSIIVVFGIVVGIVRLTKTPEGPQSSATVQGAPSIQSIPGGFDQSTTAEYARLQEQQNELQAKIAAQQGTSAIPTIIRASSFEQVDATARAAAGGAGCCNPCPCPGGVAGKGGAIPPLQSSALIPGTLVYDAKGQVIGTVGEDGKVRDNAGKIIGTVGPDGLVRDLNGNVIGAAASSVKGAQVFDSQGKLLGTVGADGKVRDATGTIKGTVDPDGVVRDLNGVAIGQAKTIPQGAVVYDAQGRKVGTVGADGKVRDANGKVLGTIGADGIVRDNQGNVVGRVPTSVPGAPVYDEQGKLIGTVGGDGRVKDSNGRTIGTIGADGIVRDANGNVIGKTGPTVPGTPVYDTQGRLVGTVGANGQVLDSSGRVLGTVGLDGNVRDVGGQIIGSTTPGGAATPTTAAAANVAALPSAEGQASPEMQAILQRQANQISEQRAEQVKSEMQGAMATQANQLLASWVSPMQQYVAGNPPEASGRAGGVGGGAGGVAGIAGGEPAVKAGTIMYAVLMTSVNSDEPGPVLASIVDGKFKGARLLGALTNQGQKVLLSFNTMTLPNISKSIPINVVAIDPNTARTALSSYTDNHYLLRYGSLFAASFIQGYGQAFQTSGQTVITNGLQTVTANPDYTPWGKFLIALGNVGTRFSSLLTDVFNTPPTVHVNSGTAMGILFLTDLPTLPT